MHWLVYYEKDETVDGVTYTRKCAVLDMLRVSKLEADHYVETHDSIARHYHTLEYDQHRNIFAILNEKNIEIGESEHS